MKISLVVSAIWYASISLSIAQSSGEKAIQLAALFSKENDKRKEKKGSVSEISIKAEPDSGHEKNYYSGSYELEGLHHKIELNIDASGAGQGGYFIHGNEVAKFSNWNVESGLLTAGMVHPDGRTHSFEGVFIIKRNGENNSKGLGIAQRLEFVNGGVLDQSYYIKQD